MELTYKLLIVFGLVIIILTFSFTLKLKELSDQNCHSDLEYCPHSNYYPLEFFFGIAIGLALTGIGIWKEFFENRKKEVRLKGEEKLIYDLLKENEGSLFQSEIVKLSGLNKVKVSRLLDRLEGKGVIIRRRRGMSNIIILKE